MFSLGIPKQETGIKHKHIVLYIYINSLYTCGMDLQISIQLSAGVGIIKRGS